LCVRSYLRRHACGVCKRQWRSGGMRNSTMQRFLLASARLLTFAAPVAAQEPPKGTTLFSRDLSDIHGKEGTMLLVAHPPGAADPVHRHNANAFGMCRLRHHAGQGAGAGHPAPWSDLL